jgi:hypothetical protein
MVVEIEGTQHRLTGTAEIQYEEWRELLRQLYLAETGFASDFDIHTEDAVELEADEGIDSLQMITVDGEGSATETPEAVTVEGENAEAEADAEKAPADTLAGATAGI